MKPYPFQSNLITGARQALVKNYSVCLQAPTGSGKTVLSSLIAAGAVSKNNQIWIIAPRNEILDQFSDTLKSVSVPHKLGKAGENESSAFPVHVWSLATLIRRIKANKIKRWPAIIVFDEAHLNIDQQLFIRDQAPDKTIFIGQTATPERLDGRGLSEMYETLVEGPSIRDLVETGFLSDVRYFQPEVAGVRDLHRKGTEYDADELEALFKERKIYGKVIEHYREHTNLLPTLVFCRSVKSAYYTAEQFRNNGFRFECIEGTMPSRRRAKFIEGIRTGFLNGLTCCELATYGLDIPGLWAIIKMRPTESKALDSQMNGRPLRYHPDKKHAIILDMVGNLSTHGHPFDDYTWNFNGTQKIGKRDGLAAASLKLCPVCFLYFTGDKCDNCGSEREKKERKDLKEVDGRLVPVEPIVLNERPPEEQREFQDRINQLTEEFQAGSETGQILPGPVGEMLKIAHDLNRSVLWVYHKLNSFEHVVNVSLLHEIARQKGFKAGWVWYQKKQLSKRYSA